MLEIKGQVLNRERVHLKIPGCLTSDTKYNIKAFCNFS